MPLHAVLPNAVPPHAVLPHVDQIEVMSGLRPESTFVQVPEVATVLAFRTTVAGESDLVVVGPRTRGSYHPNRAVPVCVRVRLRPGRARAVLGVPVHELADRAVRLTDLWGPAGRHLAARLASAGDDTGLALSHLTEALADRGRPADDPLLAAAMRELTGGVSRLGDVAARVGVGERHLRNLFAREVGLSPKHFARISRLRRVLAQAGRRQWAAVADDAGFFDQAHMIGDFRRLMGVSPGAYLSGRLPAATPCTQLSRTLLPSRPSGTPG